jgi:anti-sigma B factor antagonist
VSHASPFEIRSEREEDDGGRLILSGELDIATAPRVEEAARAMLAHGVSRLVIDLRELTFIDSSGLRMLIMLSDLAASDAWTLGLIRPADRPLSVFEITGADENLPFIEEPSRKP